MRENVIEAAIKWLEGFPTEERRGLVRALKKSGEVAADMECGKRNLRAREAGRKPWEMEAYVGQSERHGKIRFTLEFTDEAIGSGGVNPSDIPGLWLTLEEAGEVASRTMVERAAYPLRIKAAFSQLAMRQKNNHSLTFRYSQDGPGMTRAYCAEGVPDEPTISHEEALQVVQNYQGDSEKAPTHGILQTRIFRSRIRTEGEVLTIRKTLETPPGKRPRGRVSLGHAQASSVGNWEVVKGSEIKLVWPVEEIHRLQELIKDSQGLCLQMMSGHLGEEPAFATIFERETEAGFRLHKVLVAPANSKSESTRQCTDHVEDIWEQPAEEAAPPKAKMCLSHSECSWILHLLYKETCAGETQNGNHGEDGHSAHGED
jgi:hypothetical protein